MVQEIIVEVSTKGRYDNTLPLCLTSIALQTYKPHKVVIYDDNDNPRDLRLEETYQHIFKLFDSKGIGWEVKFGQKKGQHFNHEHAQTLGELVWRIDDDEIAEHNCLEELVKELKEGVGAVAGLVMQPPASPLPPYASNKIKELDKSNIQWFEWSGEPIEVEHLYSSFLYRTGIAHYNLSLSPKAHREETMFSHSIHKAGFKLVVTPNAKTWHFRSSGGIRSDDKVEDYEHDELIFRKWLGYGNLVVLKNGLGDHLMFRQVMDKLNIDTIACCYPDVFADKGVRLISIEEAMQFTDIDKYDIYGWCVSNNWKGFLGDAYLKLYEHFIA